MLTKLWNSVRGGAPPRSSFWASQPTSPLPLSIAPWEPVGDIPPPIQPTIGTVYRTPSTVDDAMVDHITCFLQDNYLEGYRLSTDYVMRKLQIPDNVSFMVVHQKQVIGFIYGQPLTIHMRETHPSRKPIPIYYVDLLCVSKEYRSQGLAKTLISYMSNFAPNNTRSFIHKKDREPLPISYFLYTRHYSIPVPRLRGDILKFPEVKDPMTAYRIFQRSMDELRESWYLEPSVDVFRSSVSVKTFICDRKELPFPLLFSMSFHRITRFGISVRTAELFYTNWEAVFRSKTNTSLMHRIFLELLNTCSLENATYFVVIGDPFPFYEMPEKTTACLPLYLHAYNLHIPSLHPPSLHTPSLHTHQTPNESMDPLKTAFMIPTF